MKRRIVLLLTLALGGPILTTAAEPTRTHVAIVNGQWQINGEVTYRGARAGGLLLNVRMVNATFEDANEKTRPKGFDPEVNTDEFIARVPDYVAQGVRATVIRMEFSLQLPADADARIYLGHDGRGAYRGLLRLHARTVQCHDGTMWKDVQPKTRICPANGRTGRWSTRSMRRRFR